MQPKYPLISIAITSYNARDSISRAIHSALEQDWPNFEVLIVDDCSTDGTEELIASLVQNEPRLRLIQHKQNLGVGAARNTLIAEARGEFIVFFDDDDESAPNRLTRQYQRITEYENDIGVELVASYAARHQRLENGDILYEATIGMDATPAPSGDQLTDYILLGRPPSGGKGSCAACSMMARKSVFEQVGGFNPSLRRSEDTDFNLRLAQLDGHFVGLAEPLVTQTISYSSDKDLSEYKANMLNWIHSHQDYLERKSLYDFSLRWMDARFDFIEGRRASSFAGLISLLWHHPLKTLRRLYWSLPNQRTLWHSIARGGSRQRDGSAVEVK